MKCDLSKKYKILYIHIGVRIYRIGIFELLAKKLGVDFFWTEKINVKNYVSEEIERLLKTTNIQYIQAHEIKNLPVDSFSFDLFKLPFLKYDVYIFTNIVSVPFLLIAPIVKLFGKKVIVFDELWRYPIEIGKYRLIYPYVKLLSKYCIDSVVAAGSKAKDFYVSNLKYDPEKIFIAHNTTVDTKYHIRDTQLDKEIKNKLENKTSKKKILFLARVIKIKGLDVLIRAMKNIPDDYDLIVVGDGDFLHYCKELVKELSLKHRVHFIGSCFSYESPYYYKYCELYVLPSRFLNSENTQVESWGFTINEAMALEKPVVSTTAVGSAYDLLIDGVTGAIAKEGDSQDLAQKVLYVLEKNKDNILGKNARKHLLKTCNYEENLCSYNQAIKRCMYE